MCIFFNFNFISFDFIFHNAQPSPPLSPLVLLPSQRLPAASMLAEDSGGMSV
ncbi:hypothetical protein BofuT4_uP089910.1 [Botrytis cinerea T4]|uniref:Uncharacterized protein n=1 Tax=Botryotinia fuckeliana (strain T4) TaxID=999810 RepID=G2YF97_BOTF4|nr:hypothetical protein BofuT4_uP089910.1 [Botrytis cinerea T4]